MFDLTSKIQISAPPSFSVKMCDFVPDDESLAEKFKREYNDQFHILVRMHLSFLLDLSTSDE